MQPRVRIVFVCFSCLLWVITAYVFTLKSFLVYLVFTFLVNFTYICCSTLLSFAIADASEMHSIVYL